MEGKSSLIQARPNQQNAGLWGCMHEVGDLLRDIRGREAKMGKSSKKQGFRLSPNQQNAVLRLC